MISAVNTKQRAPVTLSPVADARMSASKIPSGTPDSANRLRL